MLHPYRQELQQGTTFFSIALFIKFLAHLSSCSNSLVDQQLNAATSVQQLECGICYEKIFSKADSRIGLLSK